MSLPMPLVSVILPTVDRPIRLWQALESVGQQTYASVEVIVINDGGPDVEHLILRYQQTYQRPARYVAHPENRGLAAARNTGLATASGEVIALLDDDDRFRRDHLQQLVEPLLRSSETVLTYDEVLIEIEDRLSSPELPHIVATCRLGMPYRADIFDQDDYIPPSAMVFRRADGLVAGGFDEVIPMCEDWDFLLRLRQLGSFQYIPGDIGVDYNLRLAGDNLGSQFGEDRQRALRMLSERYGLPPLQPKTFLDVARDLGFAIIPVTTPNGQDQKD